MVPIRLVKPDKQFLDPLHCSVALEDGIFSVIEYREGELTLAQFHASDLDVSQKKRYDGKRLIKGVFAPLLGLLAGLLGRFLFYIVPGAHTEYDWVSLVVLFGVGSLYGAYHFVRFWFRIRTTKIIFPPYEEGSRHALSFWHSDDDRALEFWHPEGVDDSLDELVGRLDPLETGPDPNEYSCFALVADFKHLNPARTAVVSFFSTVFMMYFVAGIVAGVVRRFVGDMGDTAATVALVTFLLGIPLSVAAWQWVRLRRERNPNQKEVRRALEAFLKGDFDRCASITRGLLAESPEDHDSLSLQVLMMAIQTEYEKARTTFGFFNFIHEEDREATLESLKGFLERTATD